MAIDRRDYDDLTISIMGRTDSGFRIQARAGDGTSIQNSVLVLPEDFSDVVRMREGLAFKVRGGTAGDSRDPVVDMGEEAEQAAADAPEPNELGLKLYEALFTDEVREVLTEVRRTQAPGRGLRIRLEIDLTEEGTPELASLPWEFLNRDEGRETGFLGLYADTPVVRTLATAGVPKPLPFEPPLRILAVVANPPGTSQLDLAKEQEDLRRLNEELDNIELTILENASISKLSRKLRRNEYHVLHFMGHGDYDPHDNVGVLYMENDAGTGKELLRADDLSIQLKDELQLRLVVLNACKTAQATKEGKQDPFAGLATSLIKDAELSAVVAMQFPITNDAAITFAQILYDDLALGRPIDQAVTNARKEVRTSTRSFEWGTPVLFMNSADGLLFDLDQVDDAQPDPPPPGPVPPTPEPVQPAPEPQGIPEGLEGLEHAAWLTSSDGKVVLNWRTERAPGASDFVAAFEQRPEAPSGYGKNFAYAEDGELSDDGTHRRYSLDLPARPGLFAAYVEEDEDTGKQTIRHRWGFFKD